MPQIDFGAPEGESSLEARERVDLGRKGAWGGFEPKALILGGVSHPVTYGRARVPEFPEPGVYLAKVELANNEQVDVKLNVMFIS